VPSDGAGAEPRPCQDVVRVQGGCREKERAILSEGIRPVVACKFARGSGALAIRELSLFVGLLSPAAAQQSPCTFVLGFAVRHELIPQTVAPGHKFVRPSPSARTLTTWV
jgi:hypothetical protein